jgi:hypothetical protein
MAGCSAPATALEPQFNAGLQARDVLRILTISLVSPHEETWRFKQNRRRA